MCPPKYLKIPESHLANPMANFSTRLISSLRAINSIGPNSSRTSFRSTETIKKFMPKFYRPNSLTQLRPISIWPSRHQDLSVVQNNISKKKPQKRRRIGDPEEFTVDHKSWEVNAYSTAEEYDLEKLSSALKVQGLYNTSSMSEDIHDVLHVSARYQVDREPRAIYFFREGSVVFWNVSDIERKDVLSHLKSCEDGSYDKPVIAEASEKMVYAYTQVFNKTTLKNSQILLNSEGSTDLEKYTFSNSLALSVKLATWEATLDKYIDSIDGVVEDLEVGKIKLSRSEVLKKEGELFALRHVINLSSDLLDTPDFYWDRENLETLYQKTCNYLNIPKRTRVINEKLSYCEKLLGRLSSQLSDAHHIRLTNLIIALIATEVTVAVVHSIL